MVDVMVTNAESRVGLTLTRCLGKRGLKVLVSGSHPASPAMKSKYCFAGYVYDSSSPSAMAKGLTTAIDMYNPKVLIPILDDCLSAVHNNMNLFTGRLPPLAGKNEFDKYNDKSRLSRFAERNQIPIPESYTVKTVEDAVTSASMLQFPVIIKPKIGVFSTEVHLVGDKKQLKSAFRSIKSRRNSVFYDGSEAIVQEYIPNTLSYFNVFLKDGVLLGKQQTKIIKTYPAQCGSPVNSISVNDEMLDAAGMDVLEKMKVRNGIYNIQFIYDKKRNQYVLLEINPRIWGSIQSSIDSGVDFAYLMYLSAIGKEFAPVLTHPVGKRVKHFQMEFKSCLQKNRLSDYLELMRVVGAKTEFDLFDLKPNILSIKNDLYNLIFNGANN